MCRNIALTSWKTCVICTVRVALTSRDSNTQLSTYKSIKTGLEKSYSDMIQVNKTLFVVTCPHVYIFHL